VSLPEAFELTTPTGRAMGGTGTLTRMGTSKLKTSVEALRAEVRRIEASHPETRARLDALVADLENAAKSEGGNASLVSRVREAVLHFEVDHPRVTAILNDLLVSLSNVGM